MEWTGSWGRITVCLAEVVNFFLFRIRVLFWWEDNSFTDTAACTGS